MLPSQYINFSTFSGIGHVGHGYISWGSLWCVRVCIMCYIPMYYFISVQSSWVCGGGESFGRTLYAGSSWGSANSPRLLYEWRGKDSVINFVLCVIVYWSIVGYHRCPPLTQLRTAYHTTVPCLSGRYCHSKPPLIVWLHVYVHVQAPRRSLVCVPSPVAIIALLRHGKSSAQRLLFPKVVARGKFHTRYIANDEYFTVFTDVS